jgi:hypothetical protein
VFQARVCTDFIMNFTGIKSKDISLKIKKFHIFYGILGFISVSTQSSPLVLTVSQLNPVSLFRLEVLAPLTTKSDM